MAKTTSSWKSALGWLLFVVGALLYSTQQAFGYLHFPTVLDKYIYLFIVFSLLSAGLTTIIGGGNTSITWFKDFVIAMLCIFGVFLVFNSIGLVYDASMGSNIYERRYFSLLDAAGSNLTWGPIANVVLSCVPVAIIIIMIIFIVVGDSPDDYGTAILEGLMSIGFLLVSAWIINLTLGINIFMPF